MKHRPGEPRIKGLRLPGDPGERLDREDLREMFARGEGLDPREITIFKDTESLQAAIEAGRVYVPSDGAAVLEEALANLSVAMPEEASSDKDTVSGPSDESPYDEDPDVLDDEVDLEDWVHSESREVASVSEYPNELEYSDETQYFDDPQHHDEHGYSEESLDISEGYGAPMEYARPEPQRVTVEQTAPHPLVSRHFEQDELEDSARFHTSELAKTYVAEHVEERPMIRRVDASRKAAVKESKAAVEDGTTVFLSLAASQSDSISGTVTAPVAEPAVKMATSRLPRITDEHLRQESSNEDSSSESEGVESAVGGGKSSRLDSLTKSTVILIVGLILSKLTGQMRQVLYPHVFVEKHLTDAYVQGFLIPDFIYELLVGGSIQAAIVPTLASALGTKDERKTWNSVSIFISFISFIMLVTLLLAEIFTPQLLAPFVKPENLELTSRMARVLFPQTFFMMGAALSIGVINAYSNFLKTSFGPAIYNSLFAASLLILGTSSEQGLIYVGIGVSLSALAYFMFQVFLGRKEIAPYRFRLEIKDQGFRKLLLLAVPILFSSSIAHLNTMVLHGFTKTMESGAATALNQANSVWLLPYGVFTVAIGQAMLPTLSTLIGREREEAAYSLLSASIRRMLFFAIPSAITFFLLREDLMMGIFIWRFEGYDAQIEVTRLAARLLQWYCVSIVVQGFIYLYNYAFYAMKVTYLPLINGIISLVLTLGVGSYITQPYVLGAEGLSVSYALSGTMTALILAVLFKFRFKDLAPRFLTREWGSFFLKMIPMSIVMVGALFLMETHLAPAEIGGKIQQLIWLGARFAVAFGLWFVGGRLLKLDLTIDVEIPEASTS